MGIWISRSEERSGKTSNLHPLLRVGEPGVLNRRGRVTCLLHPREQPRAQLLRDLLVRRTTSQIHKLVRIGVVVVQRVFHITIRARYSLPAALLGRQNGIG